MKKAIRIGLLVLLVLVSAMCNSRGDQVRFNNRIDSLQNVIDSQDELFKKLQGRDKVIVGIEEHERAGTDKGQIRVKHAEQVQLLTTGYSANMSKRFGDTAVVFFESGFNNSLVRVFVNDVLKEANIIETDASTNLAGHVILDSIKTIQFVSLQIEGYSRISIQLPSRCRYIFVNQLNAELVVTFGNVFPTYD
jgi:hypothetical protein